MKKLAFILFGCFFFAMANAENYNVGVLLPQTGNFNKISESIANAINIFEDNYSTTKKKSKITAKIKNDENSVKTDTTQVLKLISDENIIALVGNLNSVVATNTAQLAKKNKIAYINPYLGSPEIVQNNDWAFQLNIPDYAQGQYMATYLKRILNKNRVLIIRTDADKEDQVYTGFTDLASRVDLKVIGDLKVVRGNIDDNWLAKNLKANDIKLTSDDAIVVLLDRESDTVQVMPQIRETYQNPIFCLYSATGASFNALQKSYIENVYTVNPFSWETSNALATDFFRKYTQKYHEEPSYEAVMFFDALLLIKNAIEIIENKEGKTSSIRARVREVISETDYLNNVPGVSGMLYFRNANLFNQSNQFPEFKDALAKLFNNGHSIIRDPSIVFIEKGTNQLAWQQITLPKEKFNLRDLDKKISNGDSIWAGSLSFNIVDVVRIGLDVNRVSNVDIKENTWSADMFMWFKWVSSRVKKEDIDSITFINGDIKDSVKLREISDSDLKFLSYKRLVNLRTPFDLINFPFDSQTLTATIGSQNNTTDRLILALDKLHVEKASIKDIKPQEWTYVDREFYSDFYRYDSTFGVPDYRMNEGFKSPIYFSTVNLKLKVKRVFQPYMFTFFLPLFIILGINLLTQLISPKTFAPRIGTIISGLVGLLLFHTGRKEAFPKVGYIIYADYFFVIAYIFMVVIMVWVIVAENMMHDSNKHQLVNKMQKQFTLWTTVSIVIIYLVMTFYGLIFLQ